MMTYKYSTTCEITRKILSQVCRRNKDEADVFLAIGKEVYVMSTTPVNAKARGRKAASDSVAAALKQQEQFKGIIRDALLGRSTPVSDSDFRDIGQLAEFRAMGL
jgi:hypothetical protein